MRRRSSKEPRNATGDTARLHLPDGRLVNVERLVDDMAKSMDALVRRVTSLEAQVDYLASKVRPS
jgi:hypothetical protein